MTSPLTSLSSPFDPLLPRVPPQDANALRQALYNVTCLFLVSILMTAIYLVTMVVLQPFLLPMLWAILSGFVLHPYKHGVVQKMSQTINEALKQSAMPVCLVAVLVVLRKIGQILDNFALWLLDNCKKILAMLAFALIWLCSDMKSIYMTVQKISIYVVFAWNALDFDFGLNNVTAMLLFIILLMLIFCEKVAKNEDLRQKSMTMSVHALWFVLATIAIGFRMAIITVFLVVLMKTFLPNLGLDKMRRPPPLITVNMATPKKASSRPRIVPRSNLLSKSIWESNKKNLFKRSLSFRPAVKKSGLYIKWLVCVCLLLQLYRHPSLLRLSILPLFLVIVRAALLSDFFSSLVTPIKSGLKSIFEDHIKPKIKSITTLMIPEVMKDLLGIYVKLEQLLLSKLNVDTLATASLLLFVLLALLLSTVLIGLQVYAECVQSAQLGGKLLVELTNTSLYRELDSYLVNTNSSLDTLLESAYISGRSYLSSAIKTLATGTLQKLNDTEALESKVLELWDRSYQFWLQKQQQSSSTMGPIVTKEAVSDSFEALVKLELFDLFDLGDLSSFMKDNMGTLLSLTDQFWVLFKGNLVLVFSTIFEVLSVILSSGSEVVNFALSLLVFVTALYYLLVNSNETYLPINLLAKYGYFLVGNVEMGLSLNKAVNAVFMLTFKMATFYALWTYLTHTLFSTSLVMLPMLLAAFLAVVPVVGHFVVAVPAVLELWLANNNVVAALMLMALHILPTLVVDTAIYSGSGVHPWVTGLAVVGGIYYFGIAGAIYGPLMLCALVVATAMSSGIVQEQMEEEEQETLSRRESIG